MNEYIKISLTVLSLGVISSQTNALTTTKIDNYPNGAVKDIHNIVDGNTIKTTHYYNTGEIEAITNFIDGSIDKFSYFYNVDDGKSDKLEVLGRKTSDCSKSRKFLKNIIGKKDQ